MNFQKRLRILRLSKGMKQTELASQLNIVKSTISSYERGKISPTAENLILLSRFFNVSIDYLLGESEYPRRIISNDDSTDAILQELGHAMKKWSGSGLTRKIMSLKLWNQTA